MKTSKSAECRFAKLVEEFFLERLMRQRNSSPQTVAAYRDCLRRLQALESGLGESQPRTRTRQGAK
jgi:site-specific recombinase XerC